MELLFHELIVINYFSEKLNLLVPANILDVSPIQKLWDRWNKKNKLQCNIAENQDLIYCVTPSFIQ